MISGKWEFREVLVPANLERGESFSANAYVDNVLCRGMNVDASAYFVTSLVFFYFDEGGDEVFLPGYASQGGDAGEWYVADRTVDFGTNDQTVSAAFYDWFTANATRID